VGEEMATAVGAQGRKALRPPWGCRAGRARRRTPVAAVALPRGGGPGKQPSTAAGEVLVGGAPGGGETLASVTRRQLGRDVDASSAKVAGQRPQCSPAEGEETLV